MKTILVSIAALILGFALGAIILRPAGHAAAQEHGPARPPLAVTTRWALPGVQGRMDHFSIDAKRGRLFLAALGNDSVEVSETFHGKRIHSIPGQDGPQGVLYLPGVDRLLVANDGGFVNIYTGDKYNFVKKLSGLDGADNLRYNEAAGIVYVSYEQGLALIDAKTLQILPKTYKFPEHPESYQLEKKGSRIFVNLPIAQSIAVFDRKTEKTVATWKVEDAKSNFPMALDEDNHRLFVVFRNPATLFVFNTENGNIIARLPCSVDVDDLYYEPNRKRIYISAAEGFIDVFQQLDADHYTQVGHVPTARGGRTSILWFSRPSQRMFVAVPAAQPDGSADLLAAQLIDY